MTVEKEYVEITEPGEKVVTELSSKEAFVQYQTEHKPEIILTDNEIEIILGYMEGHDYVLGFKDGVFLRGDLAESDNMICWEEYSMDEVIDIVCEWNYELLKESEAKMKNPNTFVDYVSSKKWYDGLKSEETALDNLFKKTKYYAKIEEIATNLASIVSENILDAGSSDISDESVKKIVEETVGQIQTFADSGRSR
jgi:hypothetical protein